MNERLYLLRISLFDIEPEIWRRFVVPGSITLDRLHDIIQIVMGWKDRHLHQFTIGNKRYTETAQISQGEIDSGKFRLVDLIKRKGSSFDYLYDYGDNWDHIIYLEDSRYCNPELEINIQCLNGKRACPPDDIGGIPGYYDFCAAMNDPTHEDHEGCKEWFSGFSWNDDDFDSEKFDLEKVNFELMKYVRWSRDRIRPWLEAL